MTKNKDEDQQKANLLRELEDIAKREYLPSATPLFFSRTRISLGARKAILVGI